MNNISALINQNLIIMKLLILPLISCPLIFSSCKIFGKIGRFIDEYYITRDTNHKIYQHIKNFYFKLKNNPLELWKFNIINSAINLFNSLIDKFEYIAESLSENLFSSVIAMILALFSIFLTLSITDLFFINILYAGLFIYFLFNLPLKQKILLSLLTVFLLVFQFFTNNYTLTFTVFILLISIMSCAPAALTIKNLIQKPQIIKDYIERQIIFNNILSFLTCCFLLFRFLGNLFIILMFLIITTLFTFVFLFKNNKKIRFILLAAIISIYSTFLALMFSNIFYIVDQTHFFNSSWFYEYSFVDIQNFIVPNDFSSVLMLINFPFDTVTIYITYWLFNKLLLERVKKGIKPLQVNIIIFIDIFICSIITILLYLTIKTIESLCFNLPLTTNLIPTKVDITILPFILTTFVPITLYLAALLLIGTTQIGLKNTEHVLKVFTEKKEEKPDQIISYFMGYFGSLLGILISISLIFIKIH